MVGRYNAPLIEFDPFNNDKNKNQGVGGVFILIAVIIGLILASITFINSHRSLQNNNNSGALVQEPADVVKETQDEGAVEQDAALYVSTIIKGDKESWALINGHMLKVGEIINNYTIKSIGNDYVEFLDKNGQTMKQEVEK